MSNTDGAAAASPDLDWGSVGGQPVSKQPTKPASVAATPQPDWSTVGGKPVQPPPGEDYGKAFASGVTQGVVGPLEAPGGYSSDVGAAAAEWTKKHIWDPSVYAGPALQKFRASLPSPADVAQKVTGGTIFDPTYKPQTFGGKVVQTGGALAPAALLGPADIPAIATRAVTQAAIPAAVTESGGYLAEKAGLDPNTGRAAASLITPFALNAAGRSLIPSQAVEEATSTLNQPGARPSAPGSTAPPPLPLPPPFAGSESRLAETGAKVLSKVPIVNKLIRGPASAAQQGLGGAAAGVAEQAGATTPATTGAAVEDAFKNANSGVSDAANTKYTAVTDAVPAAGNVGTATGPLDNLQQAAVDIRAKRAASGADPGAAINAVKTPLTMGDMTYQGMRDLRTRLRQEGDAAGLTPQERGEYESLENAVTQDINGHLDTLDPSGNASSLMKDADQTYASDRGRIQAVGRRLGIDTPNVGNEEYVNKIESMALGGKQDSELLAQTRQTLGPSVADQTAAQIAKKWWTGPDQQFAPQQFFKKYDSLTPENKDALFGKPGQGGFRDSYDALSTLAKRDPTLGSVLPAEGGGGHGGWLQSAIGGAAGAVGGAGGAHAVGAGLISAPALIKGAAAIPAPAVLSTLLARPEVAAAAARVGRASRAYEAASRPGLPTSAQQNAAKILAAETGRFQEQAKKAGYDAGQQ
jgi:hypothetical protein